MPFPSSFIEGKFFRYFCLSIQENLSEGGLENIMESLRITQKEYL